MKPYLLRQLHLYRQAIQDATQCQPHLANSLASRVLARRLLLSQAIAAARLPKTVLARPHTANRNPHPHYTTV